VMDQDDAGPGTGAGRAGIIGFPNIAIVAGKRDRFREHAFVGHVVLTWISMPTLRN
jgi:hypothetical protein